MTTAPAIRAALDAEIERLTNSIEAVNELVARREKLSIVLETGIISLDVFGLVMEVVNRDLNSQSAGTTLAGAALVQPVSGAVPPSDVSPMPGGGSPMTSKEVADLQAILGDALNTRSVAIPAADGPDASVLPGSGASGSTLSAGRRAAGSALDGAPPDPRATSDDRASDQTPSGKTN